MFEFAGWFHIISNFVFCQGQAPFFYRLIPPAPGFITNPINSKSARSCYGFALTLSQLSFSGSYIQLISKRQVSKG